MFSRKDKTLKQDEYASASEYYSAVRQGLREKANHNKFESQFFFAISIAFTLTIPLFVTLGNGDLYGKTVPAVLSVLAAGATSWLQLRKPQRLWAIYRRGQRELEQEKARFDFSLGDYKAENKKDQLLAEQVSIIAFRVHEQWEGLVPDSNALIAHSPSKITGNVDG